MFAFFLIKIPPLIDKGGAKRGVGLFKQGVTGV